MVLYLSCHIFLHDAVHVFTFLYCLGESWFVAGWAGYAASSAHGAVGGSYGSSHAGSVNVNVNIMLGFVRKVCVLYSKRAWGKGRGGAESHSP